MKERIPPRPWYRTERLADGVTLVSEPWIKAFCRCNIRHVRGRERAMVDLNPVAGATGAAPSGPGIEDGDGNRRYAGNGDADRERHLGASVTCPDTTDADTTSTDSHEVALDVGTNPIAGRVTAEDGATRD